MMVHRFNINYWIKIILLKKKIIWIDLKYIRINIVKLLQIMYDIQFKHKHANVSMIKINKMLLLRKFIKI